MINIFGALIKIYLKTKKEKDIYLCTRRLCYYIVNT